MAPLSMTLNDPNPVFKVTLFFDTGYLTNGQRYGHSYYKLRILFNIKNSKLVKDSDNN